MVNYLFIGLIIFPLMGLANERASFKPIAPVSLSIELLSEKNVDQQNKQQFKLQLTAYVAASFVINVTLPEGIELISGIDDWHGLIKAGESKSFSFTVNNQQWKSGAIEASATLVINDNVQYAAHANYLDEVGIARSKTMSPPTRHATRRGEAIVEYRLLSTLIKK